MAGSVKYLIEELGKKNSTSVECEIFYDFLPGQREIRYFRDGGGQEGWPDQCDVTAVEVKCIAFGLSKVYRKDNEDCFRLLDEIIFQEIRYQQNVLDLIMDSEYQKTIPDEDWR